MAKVKFTAAEVAEKTGLARNTVTTYCKRGLVPGAYMEGKRWMLTPESLQAFEHIRPRSEHERIGKRLQFVLDDEPEKTAQAEEPKQEEEPMTFTDEFKHKLDAETTAKLMEFIEMNGMPALDEPVHVINVGKAPAPELEWLNSPDPAVRALIDTAWQLMASASELFVKAGFRLAQLEPEEETEVQA